MNYVIASAAASWRRRIDFPLEIWVRIARITWRPGTARHTEEQLAAHRRFGAMF